MSFSILYQEYAQVYQTQQPEDSNCGKTNPVNSIPLLLRLTHPIHYSREVPLVCFLSLSHRSPTQGSKQPAFFLVAQKIHSSTWFICSSSQQCYLDYTQKSALLPISYIQKSLQVKKDKAFSDNLCGINTSLLNKCSACSASSCLFSLKRIPGLFPVSHMVWALSPKLHLKITIQTTNFWSHTEHRRAQDCKDTRKTFSLWNHIDIL